MKRKNDRKTKAVLPEKPFEIFQFPKLEGIRGKYTYEKSRFVSPIFGRSVKDVVTIPFIIKDTGDTTKRFDAFRSKKKLSEKEAHEKYGTKYYEFTNLISNKTRKDYFGGSEYVEGQEKDEEVKIGEKILSPISKKPISIYFEEKEPIFQPTDRERIVAAVKPVETDEPEIETFVRRQKPIVENPVVSGGFVDFKAEDEGVKHQEPLSYGPPLQQKPIYELPPISIFKKKDRDLNEKPDWLLDQIDTINQTLEQFGIEGSVSGSKKGPTVTRYEIALKPGVNVKRISGISDNLMMNLSSKSIRIEAPIPGKPYVGLEVPNVKPEIVAFGNVVDTKEFLEDRYHPLKVALGVDIDGENIYIDISSMPHGLIAGATNSGKSVCVNTILVSLLIKNKPEDLKLILIDPKMVEMMPYNDLPHLVTPVITDSKMAASALAWSVSEMDRRYQVFASSRSKDIKSFNENVKNGVVDLEKMPYIIIIIDELADLMSVAAHDVEAYIQRLTQKARAAGIHLLVATQRPTTDVVKGTIKSNIPVRMAFKVASFVDSTTILDGAGAETLLGKGDMLLKRTDRAHRLQGAFISDEEIYAVTDFIRKQQKPNYVFDHEELKEQVKTKEIVNDDLFEDVAYFVVTSGSASINGIQKEFEIGFNRAQKLVEMLEYHEIVSTGQGTKAREVLVTLTELNEILGNKA
ncbi:MAG: DNA translocase FtsK [Acholeplasmataceae bacterium]